MVAVALGALLLGAGADGYRVLGVDVAGHVVLRHVSVSEGIDRVETLAPGNDEPSVVPPAPGVLEPVVPGAVSPGRDAALLVRIRREGSRWNVTVERAGSAGFEPLASRTAECDATDTGDPPSAEVFWAFRTPAHRIGVVVGALPACEGQSGAFALAVPIDTALTDVDRAALALRLVAEATPPDFDGPLPTGVRALEVASGLEPESAAPWILLARARVTAGDPGGAVSALWQVARLTEEGAREALAAALDSPWASELSDRAGFRALRATVPAPPVPEPEPVPEAPEGPIP